MPDYYDPDGEPMTMWQWAELFERRRDTPNLLTVVKGGVPWREQQVSTVWLGLDHSFGWGPPLIYETLVFPDCTLMLRYPNRRIAWLGHWSTVATLRAQCEGHRWDRTQMRAGRERV